MRIEVNVQTGEVTEHEDEPVENTQQTPPEQLTTTPE